MPTPPENAARGRRYIGFFDGSNEAERAFLRMLPISTARVNRILAEKKYKIRLTEAEVATNFISEGAYFPLNFNDSLVSAYQHLGVDNYVGMRWAYRKWATKDVDALADLPAHVECQNNEQHIRVCSLKGLTVEQAVDLSAAIFGYYAAIASRDIANFETLPAPARFFWATMYYNVGPGKAREFYKRHGVEYYKKPWKGPANSSVARFNALWRTNSLAILVKELPAYDSVPAEPEIAPEGKMK